LLARSFSSRSSGHSFSSGIAAHKGLTFDTHFFRMILAPVA
jgi:hypothetical protein